MLPDVPSADTVLRRPHAGHARRFAIAWRNASTREISAVAVLDFDGGLYRFWYLPSSKHVHGFRRFLGFPDADRVYISKELFPFFAVRVMDPRRPDFAAYVRALGLPPRPTPLDVLSRSGGERKGDTVQVVEAPWVDDGGFTESTFLVRGVRYAQESHGTAEAIQALVEGESLAVAPEPSNPVNPNALLVTTNDGRGLGWVPDLLIAYVNEVQANGDLSLRIVRNNGADSPWHLRLLVRLTGHTTVRYRPFSGPEWEPLAVHARA